MTNRTDTPATRRAKHPQVRALCCGCGTLRMTSTWGAWDGEDAFATYGRCVVWRKCRTCGETTAHARLLDERPPDERDVCEERDSAAPLRAAVDELIATFEACEVPVEWSDDDSCWRPAQVAMLTQWLDDGTFRVRLNPAAHVLHVVGALEAAWLELLREGDDRGGWRSTLARDDCPPSRYRMFLRPE